MTPFSHRKADTVAALGEERLISAIRRWLGDVSPPAPLGIGDDCAILPASKKAQAITVDPVIYRRHFDDSIPPCAVGAKLLKRNLSDLAAMGAKPRAAVVALTLDPRTRLDWLEKFYRGLAACARTYNLAIVGGDVAQADKILAASLTLIGEASGSRMLTRAGARSGDWIYVTGPLGGSLLGKHHRFTPRLSEGAWLAAHPEVRAMMDLSDGLAKDLHALTPSNAEPALDPALIPISPAARKLARDSKRTPLAHALGDGEDFELLFAVRKNSNRASFEKTWLRHFRQPLYCIGNFVSIGKRPAGSIDLNAHRGYEHLR
ncbi:thiamine-monophosphate kinase [Nibricoccus aquaticus]|uniref:Thiamine-monophosphate kinase n=1 Tax=Nibricoccus aquaticus TaxID=2576891 RepID=A0A290QES3_9BACT|nr:thiamine-phosphate kinase [Nibricoccus aquaticus]ATC62851.1 thiamine-monophosphate kinase [Nibricoccus aquaticus]